MNGGIIVILAVIAVIAFLLLLLDVARDGLRRQRERREIERLEREDLAAGEALERPDRLGKLRRRLNAAGIYIPPALFLCGLLVVAFAIGILVWGLLEGALIAGLIAFLAALYATLAVIREVGRARAIRFEEKLVDSVDLLVVALQSGENPNGAFVGTAEASPNPVRREFDEVVNRLNLGMHPRRALGRLSERYDSEGVRLFCHSIIAKWRAGGDLAPVLQKVARIMRERVQHRMRLESQMAGARLSALFVAIAPYILVIAFYFRQPSWLNTLFAHPVGPTALVVAILLQIIGFIWLNRLARVEL